MSFIGTINIDEMRKWYRLYFQMFKAHAPKHMVEWGGYQLGEPTGMASSFESVMEFAKIIENRQSVILNAGAGASSWMLRKIFPNVICTDPSNEYLQVVLQMCSMGGLSNTNFIAGLDQCPDCDYCYYDYGNIERMPSLDMAVKKTKYALYVDDTDTRDDCAEYRQFAYGYAVKNNLKIRDCQEACDEYGRWGVFLLK